jgi:hypothetical protein
LGNIIHHKSVKSKIPPYFKDQSVPLISYVYIRPIASKMFNYKHVLRVYGIRLTVFRPVGEHLSQRGVVDNFKITSYNVASRIIMNGELAQVQSGGLDLKSSILRLRNT